MTKTINRVLFPLLLLAQETALVAAITFLPRHGASTRLPIGSQINPSEFWSAGEGAAKLVNLPRPEVVNLTGASIIT